MYRYDFNFDNIVHQFFLKKLLTRLTKGFDKDASSIAVIRRKTPRIYEKMCQWIFDFQLKVEFLAFKLKIEFQLDFKQLQYNCQEFLIITQNVQYLKQRISVLLRTLRTTIDLKTLPISLIDASRMLLTRSENL